MMIYYQFAIGVMLKIFAIKVFFQITVAVEGFQAVVLFC